MLVKGAVRNSSCYSAHLMHGKVCKKNHHVVFNSNNQACITFISATYNFHMITHFEMLL